MELPTSTMAAGSDTLWGRDSHCCLWGRQGEEGSGVVLLVLLPIYGILSMYPVMPWDETGGPVD